MSRKFHRSEFHPTIKETENGEWYIIFELREGVGIHDADCGNREAAILFPKGTAEGGVKKVRDLLNNKGMEIVYIE